MIRYDKNAPLIVIHIPKAAGTSVKEIFKRWYMDSFYEHYYNEVRAKMPRKLDLVSLQSKKKPILIYGHFNQTRGFGIEEYYPNVKQFVTILRDPFERMVSSYFYKKKVSSNWKDKSRTPYNGLEEYILAYHSNYLVHFPREVTQDNYKDIIEEYFVEIGIMESLDESLSKIAKKLGYPYSKSWVEHKNATKRDEEIPSYLQDMFFEKNRLQYEVYDYVAKKFSS